MLNNKDNETIIWLENNLEHATVENTMVMYAPVVTLHIPVDLSCPSVPKEIRKKVEDIFYKRKQNES